MSTRTNNPSRNPTRDPAMATAEYRNTSYSSRGDTAVDTAEYRDETADIPIGARGADNLPTAVNAEQEDAAAARSEDTGRVSKDEVEDLLAGTSEEERSKTGTRGVKNDAFRKEAALDAMDFSERI